MMCVCDEPSGDIIFEAAESLFRLGYKSPLEMSLGRGNMDKEDTNIVNTPISDSTEGEDKVPLFEIIFIEVGGRRICGGSVEGEVRLCMPLVDEYNTASHT